MRIDWWTLALQTINVLVLIWILARFLFRPVADIIARRQEQASKLLADAAATRDEAAKVRAELEMAHAGINAERDQLLTEAHKSAQQERSAMLAQASDEIAKLRHEADAGIAQERAAAQDALVAHASELAVEIAQRLLARLPPQTGLSAFLGGLRQEVQALAPEVKRGLASQSSEEASVAIVTAGPLSQDEMAQVRAMLAEAVGAGDRVPHRPRRDRRDRAARPQHHRAQQLARRPGSYPRELEQ